MFERNEKETYECLQVNKIKCLIFSHNHCVYCESNVLSTLMRFCQTLTDQVLTVFTHIYSTILVQFRIGCSALAIGQFACGSNGIESSINRWDIPESSAFRGLRRACVCFTAILANSHHNSKRANFPIFNSFRAHKKSMFESVLDFLCGTNLILNFTNLIHKLISNLQG